MNRNSSQTCVANEKSLQPAQSESPGQSQSANISSTIAFTPEADPGSRVVTQLDNLTVALEKEAASERSMTPRMTSAAMDEDECLESYLHRYVQQLTGKSQNSVLSDEPLASEEKLPNIPPEEPKPSRQVVPAPENRDQFVAMRELAHESARRAMAESSQIQRVIRMRRAYFEAKAASIASTTLALAYFATHSSAALNSATMLFALALLLSFRCVRLHRQCSVPAAS